MKKVLSLVLTLAMLATMCVFTGVSVSAAGTQWDGKSATAFSGGGTGIATDPYKIDTAAELKLFANIVNGLELTNTEFTQNESACGILTADIVLNNGTFTADENNAPLYNGEAVDEGNINVWFPIGYYHDTDGNDIKESVYYGGTFNGNGHTVSGLYFNNTNQSYAGLFGWIKSGADISNLGVVNSYIRGGSYIGGVCGYISSGTITNCYNTGSVNGPGSSEGISSYIGGVCGFIREGTITDCYNTGDVSGAKYYVGGVCGMSKATITDCYNTGEVSGTESVGGVCGYISSGAVTGCYNAGTVEGDKYVGGVCGLNYSAISDCYNAGTVSCTDSSIGGVCGYNYDRAEITNCYYLKGTATNGIGVNEGTGSAESKTEAQMKTPEFVDLLNSNGGSFTYYIGKLPLQSWQPDPNIYGTVVTYNVAPDYIVTIPEEVTLGGTATVSAENVVLDEGKQLQIALTGTSGADNAFTVSNGKTTTLTYQVTDNSTSNIIALGGNVLTVNPTDSARGSSELKFSNPTNSVKYSGKYTGTVTFTVSVADAA